LPIRIKAFPIFAYWHDSKDGDPAHAWFRERLVKSITGAMQSSPT